MRKIFYYMVLIVGMMLVIAACEDKDYELMQSALDDYVSDTGGDYYDGEGIDVSMYDKARIFPGLVDTLTEKRLDEVVVELDMKKRYVPGGDMNLNTAPSPIYSIGLYAGAGEKVTIELEDDIKGLSVQIGIHSRDLTSLATSGFVSRDAKVVNSMPLFKGKNEIRNPYGGYIWIRRSGNSGADLGTISIKVKGVYAVPDYIMGETKENAAEWMKTVKETTVPWMELRGNYISFSVPTNYIRKKIESQGQDFINNMEEALRLWDEWLLCIYEFYGMDNVDRENFPLPDYPTRAIMDAHLITERYSYYNNDGVELLETEELIDMITSPESIKNGDLNTVHIMGWLQLYMYKQQYSRWYNIPDGFSAAYQLMPNFYFLYKNNWWNRQNNVVQQYATVGTNIMSRGKSYEITDERIQNLISFASADTCKLYNPNAKVTEDYIYTAFTIMADILSYEQIDSEKNGWKFWGYYNRYLVSSGRYQTVTDGLITALTEYFERDFTSLFDRWGLEISDGVRLDAMQKPHVEKSIWEYNPLTKADVSSFDGKIFYTRSGDLPFRHDRKDWVAAAYSGKGSSLKPNNYKEENTPFNLFDGERNTLWSSYYDNYQDYTDSEGVKHYAFKEDRLYYNATTPEFPYTIVVSPGNGRTLSSMNGFYLAYGNSDEASIYNGDRKDYDKFSFGPQHIIVEITTTPLEFEDADDTFVNLSSAEWKKVYDSDDDPKGGERQQFWADRHNLFYIDLETPQSDVRGIRLTFDKDSHTAKDRPLDWSEEEQPNRPEFANKNLNRIQKFGEFGTYYYNN